MIRRGGWEDLNIYSINSIGERGKGIIAGESSSPIELSLSLPKDFILMNYNFVSSNSTALPAHPEANDRIQNFMLNTTLVHEGIY
jgi:hypothetical protein